MRFVIVLAALSLAGCGAREPLQPAAGRALPPASAQSTRALTPDELLAVPSEFRPLRVDEPLTRSQRREPDRFALPPPDEEGEAAAEPQGNETEAATSPPQ